MSPLPEPALDDRYDDLVAQLRAERPRPPEELRLRIRQLAVVEPVAKPRAPRLRRAVFVLAPALVVAVVLGAAIQELPRGNSGNAEEAQGGEALGLTETMPAAESASDDATAARSLAPLSNANTSQAARGAFTPTPGRRLQEYQAELRVHVDGRGAVGAATSRAMRTTRALGGYVVVANYGAPNREHADSLLVVRVPVERVQDAIFRFSQLGSIVSQQIRIQDLQAGFTRQEAAIARLRREIVALIERLRDPTLSPEQRAQLRVQLLTARQELANRIRTREATLRRGRLSRISLTLTTREGAISVPKPPGYVERTLRDAVSAVGKVLAWILYALIVTSPFLVLAALALVLERLRRRRADERLLERAAA